MMSLRCLNEHAMAVVCHNPACMCIQLLHPHTYRPSVSLEPTALMSGDYMKEVCLSTCRALDVLNA